MNIESFITLNKSYPYKGSFEDLVNAVINSDNVVFDDYKIKDFSPVDYFKDTNIVLPCNNKAINYDKNGIIYFSLNIKNVIDKLNEKREEYINKKIVLINNLINHARSTKPIELILSSFNAMFDKEGVKKSKDLYIKAIKLKEDIRFLLLKFEDNDSDETLKECKKILYEMDKACNYTVKQYGIKHIHKIILTVGRYNVYNVALVLKKNIYDKKHIEFYSDTEIEKCAYSYGNKITSIASTYSKIFGFIPEALEYLFRTSNTFSDKESPIHKEEVYKAIFIKFVVENDILESIFEISKNGEGNTALAYSNKYCFLYNLLASYIAYYQSFTYSSISEIVRNNTPRTTYTMGFTNDYNGNYSIHNYSDIETVNFFCNSFDVVYSVCQPIKYSYFIETDSDNSFDKLFSKLNNHTIRYMALNSYRTIVTSQVYLSLCCLSNNLIRARIRTMGETQSSLSRMFAIHRLARQYAMVEKLYSSAVLFNRTEHHKIYNILYNLSNSENDDKGTDLLTKNLWQEANITNGKVVPIASLIVAFISLIVSFISFGLDTSSLCYPIRVTLFIVGDILVSISMIVIIVFSYITSNINKNIVNINK